MDDKSYRRHAAIVRSAVQSVAPRVLATSALSLLLRGSERGVASGYATSPFFGRLRGMRDKDVIALISKMSNEGFHVETRSEGVVLLPPRSQVPSQADTSQDHGSFSFATSPKAPGGRLQHLPDGHVGSAGKGSNSNGPLLLPQLPTTTNTHRNNSSSVVQQASSSGAALAAAFRARSDQRTTSGIPGGITPSTSGMSSFPTDGGGFLRASDVIPLRSGGAPAGSSVFGPSSAGASTSLNSGAAAPTGIKEPSGNSPPDSSSPTLGDDDEALFGPGGDPYKGLAHEQAAVLRLVRAGRSLFFTGPAGAGKSHVLRRAIRMLVWMHTPQVQDEQQQQYGGGEHGFGGEGRFGEGDGDGEGEGGWTAGRATGGEFQATSRPVDAVTSAAAAFGGDVETDPALLVAVTASTGIAACNVGGRTLHSWAGLGRGEDPLDSLIAKLAPKRGKMPRRGTAAHRMMHARALVVDEVSMLDGQLLDKLDHLLRAVRKCPRPMGGLQVLLCGDFFQLPPTGLGQGGKGGMRTGGEQRQQGQGGGGVQGWGKGRGRGRGGRGEQQGAGQKQQKKKNPFDRARAGSSSSSDSSRKSAFGAGQAAAVTLDSYMHRGGKAVGEGPICFAFQAQVWPAIASTSVVLRRVFRQKDDRFVALLNQLRRGAVEVRTEALLRYRERAPLVGPAGMRPTRLYARNAEVSRENALALLRCQGEERRFECEDVHCANEGEKRQLAQGVSAETKLKLKPGAQVILLKNIDPRLGLANGAQGVVVGFVPSLAAPDELVRSKPAGVPGLGVVVKSVQDARGLLLGMRRAPREVPLVRFPISGRAADALADLEEDAEGVKDEKAEGVEESVGAGAAGNSVTAEGGAGGGKDEAGPPSPGRAMGGGFPAWVEFPVLPVAFEINSAAATGDGPGRRFNPQTQGFQRQSGPTRKQVPLKLAYALTIHRSQGMTLPLVDVDLQHIFSPGQAYVALSRAVSLEGLRVRNYRRGCIHAHPEAGAFNRQLGRVHAMAMRENKRLATAEAEGGERGLLDAADKERAGSGSGSAAGAARASSSSSSASRSTSSSSSAAESSSSSRTIRAGQSRRQLDLSEGEDEGGEEERPAVRAPAAFGGAAAADSLPLEDSDPLGPGMGGVDGLAVSMLGEDAASAWGMEAGAVSGSKRPREQGVEGGMGTRSMVPKGTKPLEVDLTSDSEPESGAGDGGNPWAAKRRKVEAGSSTGAAEAGSGQEGTKPSVPPVASPLALMPGVDEMTV